MRRFSGLLVLSAAIVLAAEPAWKSKEVTEWTPAEAEQVLANSPWVRNAEVTVLPQRSEALMRDSGHMGGANGAGIGGLGPSIFTGVGDGKRLVPKAEKRQTFLLRWESARTVRAAELKLKDERAPAWDGDYYALAIYGVPGLEDQKHLPVELRKTAFLRRHGNKDLKPAKVDLLFDGDLATLVYLFPRSQPITQQDRDVWFAAQIGQIFVEQSFHLAAMEFLGKLEL
jgi:hypothetical protein